MNKKIVLIVTTTLVVFSTASSLVRAQDSTSSSETTQKLKERIEKIVDEKRDRVQGTIDELSERRRGFIGEVQRVNQEAITIKNHKGTQIISLSEDVTLLKAGKSIAVDTIAVGDWLVVIGVVEDDAFVAKRILVSSTSLRPKDHFVLLGTITERSSTELTVLTRSEETVTVTTSTKNTSYQDRDGETVKATEFTKDMQVLVVGTEESNGKAATVVRTIVSLDSLQTDD